LAYTEEEIYGQQLNILRLRNTGVYNNVEHKCFSGQKKSVTICKFVIFATLGPAEKLYIIRTCYTDTKLCASIDKLAVQSYLIALFVTWWQLNQSTRSGFPIASTLRCQVALLRRVVLDLGQWNAFSSGGNVW